MALSFHPTTASLFGHHRLPAPNAAADMSFLQDDDDDVHSEVTDALLGFVYDPLDASNAALDDLLSLPPPSDAAAAFLAPLDGATRADQNSGKRQRIGGGNQQVPLMNDEYVLQLPLPPPPPVLTTQVPEPLVFVHGADSNKNASGGASQSVQKSAARQRRKRISEKTAELARLIPGAHKLNTAEMLEEAARHVKLLQAQVGVLALMRAAGSSEVRKKWLATAAHALHCKFSMSIHVPMFSFLGDHGVMVFSRHLTSMFFVTESHADEGGEDAVGHGAGANARAAGVRRRAGAADRRGQVSGADESGGRRGQGPRRQGQPGGAQGPRPVRGVAAGEPVRRRRRRVDRSRQGRRLHPRARSMAGCPFLTTPAVPALLLLLSVFLTPDPDLTMTTTTSVYS